MQHNLTIDAFGIYLHLLLKDNVPDWKVQTSEWNVENTSQWKTEDTDKFFYEIEEKNMIENVKMFVAKPGIGLKVYGTNGLIGFSKVFISNLWR